MFFNKEVQKNIRHGPGDKPAITTPISSLVLLTSRANHVYGACRHWPKIQTLIYWIIPFPSCRVLHRFEIDY